MRLISMFGLCLVLVWPAQARAQPKEIDPEGRVLRVLLIGNSYTYGMRPQLIRLFKADPEYGLTLGSRTPGGRFLIQHLNDPESLERVADHEWDVIVLQDHSQSANGAYLNYVASGSDLPFARWAAMQSEAYTPPEDGVEREHLDERFWIGATGMTRHALEHSDATVYYFVTWPRHPDEFDKPRNAILPLFSQAGGADAAAVMSRYNTLAYGALHETFPQRTRLIPVNQAWDTAYARDAQVRLHVGDHSHANTLGSMLAAATIYRAITGTPIDRMVFPEDMTAGGIERVRAVLREVSQADE